MVDAVAEVTERRKEMNYIINPSWFYFLGVVNAIEVVSILGTIFFGIVFGGLGIGIVVDRDVYNDDEMKRFRKLLKGVAAGFVISVLLLIFLPSKTTLIEMQIARMATHDNVEWTVEQIKSVVDYIIEAARSLK